ncbi:MAG: leucine-rich repeat protein [Clostridia bacterium]|nr:leucine-rich repeat protein [Clostridia bacterium]
MPTHYIVRCSLNEHCTISLETNKSYIEGELVRVNIEPIYGYKVSYSYYLKDGESEIHIFNNSFTMPASNITIYAELAELEQVSVNKDSLGSATIDGDTFSAKPASINNLFLGLFDASTGEIVSLNTIDDDYFELVDLDSRYFYSYHYVDYELASNFFKQSKYFSYKSAMSSILSKAETKKDNGEISARKFERIEHFVDEMNNNKFISTISADSTKKYKAIFAKTATEVSQNGFDFLIYREAKVAVLKSYTGSATEIVIPSEIDGATVVGIQVDYKTNFNGSDFTQNIFPATTTKITLPITITTILPYTFYGLNNLVEVNAPAVREVGRYAFAECGEFNAIFTDSLERVGDYAFNGATITGVDTLKIKEIGVGAFQNCTFQSFKLNADFLGADAFKDSKVYSVTINKTEDVESITDLMALQGMLVNAKNISTITPNTYLDNNYFRLNKGGYYYYGIVNLLVDRENYGSIFVKYYGSSKGYLQLSLLDGLELYYCQINDGEKFYSSVFDCSNVEIGVEPTVYIYLTKEIEHTITSGSYTSTYILKEGSTRAILKSSNDPAFAGQVTKDGVTYIVDEIANGAFKYATIESVAIPATIKTIGDRAFFGASIKYVEFQTGSQLEVLSASVFMGCSNLIGINLEVCTNLASIGDYAFFYCSKLSSIVIPEKAVVSNNDTFENCTSLKNVEVKNSALASFTSNTSCGYLFYYADVVKTPYRTWQDSDYLYKNLALTESTSSYCVFKKIYLTYSSDIASSYYKMTINNVSKIVEFKFTYTASNYSFIGWQVKDSNEILSTLNTFNLPITANMATEYYAIVDTTKSITIDGLTFKYSTYYKTAKITSDSDSITGDLVIPSSITCNEVIYTVNCIGSNAFYSNQSITSVTIPSTIISIEHSAFSYCPKLKNVYYSGTPTLKSIGQSAFTSTAIKKFYFPSSVKFVDIHCFLTASLDEVIIDGEIFSDSRILSYSLENSKKIYILNTIDYSNIIPSMNNYFMPRADTILENKTYKTYERVDVFTNSEKLGSIYKYIYNQNQLVLKVNNYYGGFVGWHKDSIDGELISTEINYTLTLDDTSASTYYAEFSFIDYTDELGLKYYLLPEKIAVLYGNENITTEEIVIPDKVLYNENEYEVQIITQYAFNENDITSIAIPATVRIIESYAIHRCDNLTSIIFAENSQLNQFSTLMIQRCNNLTKVKIPANVTSISDIFSINCYVYIDSATIYEKISNNNLVYEDKIYIKTSIDDGSNTYLNANFTKVVGADGYNEYTIISGE